MTTRNSQPIRLELSRAEEWLVHTVMLDGLGLAGPGSDSRTPTPCELRILEQLENGPPVFTPIELDHIRHACGSYSRAKDVPTGDRDLAADILHRIDDAFGDDLPQSTAP